MSKKSLQHGAPPKNRGHNDTHQAAPGSKRGIVTNSQQRTGSTTPPTQSELKVAGQRPIPSTSGMRTGSTTPPTPTEKRMGD